ncbi:peptidoglycan-associated lipoprotein Pal [Sandaracinobacteroides saxicola]|uniref:Peptidoglycan-associated lipoprotein n=1 Tax=Sandaracinobacteroides saxicola TaxID=2759707 RepID=A0A7G5IMA7_9SPHN|nr:peptidoglycan-associated lipoprotein Pal [Sandaracinobacteroides saxicola]QMW24499.1 peptidoglycan-associated lipoprotein Pal [Sandaracinobacteroides saxicola]
MRKTTLTLITLTSLLALAACGRKAADLPPPPPQAAPATPPAAEPGPAPATPAVGTTAVPGSSADFVAQSGSDRVLFATDSYELDEDARQTLGKQATWLTQYSGVKVSIEGHADERGTREYNLALGERRANAAKNFLAANGVDASRMSVISYGKERPVAEGSDEAAWAQNRRAVTVIISGAAG